MELSDILTNEAIRSVLTVSETDLPDELLSNSGFEDEITYILNKRIPTWSEIDLQDLQEGEENKVLLLKLYSKFKAAAIVAETAPVFILKKITDGNNEMQRSDKDGFLWLTARLSARANQYLNDLLEEFDIPVGAGVNIISRVEPGRDSFTQSRTELEG